MDVKISAHLNYESKPLSFNELTAHAAQDRRQDASSPHKPCGNELVDVQAMKLPEQYLLPCIEEFIILERALSDRI